jgi:hypothetical protein
MVRLLILTGTVVILAYVNMTLFFGFLLGLTYSIVCGVIDERREGGDC